MMVDPPAWFQAFVYCEILFQLPFFILASYVFIKGIYVNFVVLFVQWHVFGSVWRCPLQFPWRKREKRRSVCFYSYLFVEGSCFIFYLYILTYTVIKHRQWIWHKVSRFSLCEMFKDTNLGKRVTRSRISKQGRQTLYILLNNSGR
jgi:hypothetical protein